MDPHVTAGTLREAALLNAIRKKGMALHRVHAHPGSSLRLTGPDVHVTVASLANLVYADLLPPPRR